jgi:hypothetical protein
MNEPGPFSIFPNPARDFVTVKCVPGYKTLEVFDISGRRYITKILTGVEMTVISLSHFPSGIYIIRVSSGREFSAGCLIKLE